MCPLWSLTLLYHLGGVLGFSSLNLWMLCTRYFRILLELFPLWSLTFVIPAGRCPYGFSRFVKPLDALLSCISFRNDPQFNELLSNRHPASLHLVRRSPLFVLCIVLINHSSSLSLQFLEPSHLHIRCIRSFSFLSHQVVCKLQHLCNRSRCRLSSRTSWR